MPVGCATIRVMPRTLNSNGNSRRITEYLHSPDELHCPAFVTPAFARSNLASNQVELAGQQGWPSKVHDGLHTRQGTPSPQRSRCFRV